MSNDQLIEQLTKHALDYEARAAAIRNTISVLDGSLIGTRPMPVVEKLPIQKNPPATLEKLSATRRPSTWMPPKSTPSYFRVTDKDSKWIKEYTLVIGSFNNQLQVKNMRDSTKDRVMEIKANTVEASKQIKQIIYNSRGAGHSVEILQFISDDDFLKQSRP